MSIHRVSVEVTDYQELDLSGPVISVAADRGGRSTAFDLWFDQQIAAAREALKPIREWSDKHRGECSWIDELLDDLAPLIYTTEELE